MEGVHKYKVGIMSEAGKIGFSTAEAKGFAATVFATTRATRATIARSLKCDRCW